MRRISRYKTEAERTTQTQSSNPVLSPELPRVLVAPEPKVDADDILIALGECRFLEVLEETLECEAWEGGAGFGVLVGVLVSI